MSTPFLCGHAAPSCAPEGTCACSAPLHGGGGGSRSLFIALCSRPSAGLAPPCVCVCACESGRECGYSATLYTYPMPFHMADLPNHGCLYAAAHVLLVIGSAAVVWTAAA